MVQLIRIFFVFIFTISIAHQSWSHDGQLEFEVNLKEKSVCQEFSFHEERVPHLDQCVSVHNFVNQKIEVVKLVNLLNDVETFDQTDEDPLNFYDVKILSDKNQAEIIKAFKRLDINHLSVVNKVETRIVDDVEQTRFHFVVAVDWEKKSGHSGTSYIEGVVSLDEEALMFLIESDGKGLAETLKEGTEIIRISSKDGEEPMGEEDIQEKIVPVVAAELAFVSDLRVLLYEFQLYEYQSLFLQLFKDKLEELKEKLENPQEGESLELQEGGANILRPSIYYDKPKKFSL